MSERGQADAFELSLRTSASYSVGRTVIGWLDAALGNSPLARLSLATAWAGSGQRDDASGGTSFWAVAVSAVGGTVAGGCDGRGVAGTMVAGREAATVGADFGLAAGVGHQAEGGPAGLLPRPKKTGAAAMASNTNVKPASNLNATAWLTNRPSDDGWPTSTASSFRVLAPATFTSGNDATILIPSRSIFVVPFLGARGSGAQADRPLAFSKTGIGSECDDLEH
ncbi:MAG: hypothetical protein ABFC63_10855 [Thermoguttaceae bacterium]